MPLDVVGMAVATLGESSLRGRLRGLPLRPQELFPISQCSRPFLWTLCCVVESE